MRHEDWEPIYLRILDYFGFSRDDDEKAAKILSDILANTHPRDDVSELEHLIRGKKCIVAGNAPTLRDDIKKTDFSGAVLITADAASSVLYRLGHRPDAIVSDIDGMDDDFLEMNKKGTILVLHAHGDNIPLVKNWVPKVEGKIVGTTQSTPLVSADA